MLYPPEPVREHNERINMGFLSTILEHIGSGVPSRRAPALPLRAGAALSLCDTRLNPALGVSVGRRHPGAQCQPQSTGTRLP